ncbi:TolC family protein [Anoxybacterium hadale]|uniref:TolC family protein n=1 Tax=Anoxybacterium hadale TaxID=3408580 RepID=A0ACD1AEC0_9FIRM|nr:TolC family protein [Clostridiales bacterium]
MKREICFTLIMVLLMGTACVYGGEASPGSAEIQTTGASVTDTSGAAATGPAITGPAITEEDAAASASVISAKPIPLSMKEAVKIMQTTGARAQTAELNKKSDIALAEGYSEAVTKIGKVLDGLDLLDKYKDLGYVSPATVMEKSVEAQENGATTVNKKVMRLRRDFAKGQIDSNYKAEMNQIEYETLKVYYGVLLAADNLKTEEDNLKTQQDILKNTKAQYEAGMLAKKDVLSAESGVTSAKSSMQSAQTKLEYARMSFNYLLGYSATQAVNFTDKLEVVSAAAIDTEAAVSSALNRRNEIKGTDFAVQVHKILLEDLTSYPRSSSTYMKQQIALLSAEKTKKDAPVLIEIEVRNKAAELEDKTSALKAARAMQDYAQEGYRLINISYQAGMTTLAELQQAQLNVYKAGLAVSKAISDYDLAVYDFHYAADVGTGRLPL